MGTKALIIKKETENSPPELKRILVALNSLQEREDLAVALLQKYDVSMLDDGVELMHAIPRFRPHLIIVESDIESVSGFQVTHLLKHHPELSQIPLILLLTHGYQIGEFWSREVGVDSCQHTDDLEPAKLMQTIDDLLEKSKDAEIDEITWQRIESHFTGAGLITNLSTTLDQILLESSVLNRIALLAQEPTDIRKLTRSIMYLLRNILEYSAAAIQIFSNGQIYTFVHKDMSEADRVKFLNDAREYTDIYYMTSSKDLNKKTEEVPLGTFHLEYDSEELNPTIFTLPLEAPNKTLGTLTLLTNKSVAKREYYLNTLNLITHHISLALNNAILYQEVHRLSTVDELTSLPNRRAFYEVMHNELIRSRRYKVPISLAIIDIDNFKIVNDTYGHLQGDKVLQECGRIFRSSVRDKIDTVARFGGEEFIILFPQTNLAKAKGVVERLHDTIQKHSFDIIDNGGTLRITISIGLVSVERGNDVNVDDIINAADKALYEAKNSGRNRIVIGELPETASSKK